MARLAWLAGPGRGGGVGRHRRAHTDTTPFADASGSGNWELSSQRANAARRALVDGGMDEAKLSRVVGLSSSVPFDKTDPRNPINRRISIVVLSDAAERIDAEDQAAIADLDAATGAHATDAESLAQLKE